MGAIKKFRADASKFKGNRKAFIEEKFTKEILKVYAEEIKANDLKTRESSDVSLAKFIKTKKATILIMLMPLFVT